MVKSIKTIVMVMSCGVLWVDGTARGHVAGRDEVLARYGHLTAHFEPVGASSEEGPRFVSRGRGYALLVSRQGAMLALKKPAATGDDPTLVRMQMLGSNPRAAIVGTRPLSSRMNYFIGNDP